MELGMIGLGRMGTNMVRRLRHAGHQCVVYDIHPEPVNILVKEGAVGAKSLEEFTTKMKRPRAIWMMVPAAVVDPTLKSLIPFLERDDVLIDGGNSYYHDDLRRAAELKPKGIHYVDVGTSGGVWGSERGYCQVRIRSSNGSTPFSLPWLQASRQRRAHPAGSRAVLRSMVTCTAVHAARAISSRWFITVSSTD
jgi:6-phosphogluconate dehydrogenase (decarboxylating)